MPASVDLTFDCHDPRRVADFWKLVLGYEDEPAPEPFSSREEWLAHHGVPREEWDAGAWLRDPSGIGPRLSFLRVPEPKVAKNRLHMDVHISDGASPEERWQKVVAASSALVDAGAQILAEVDGHHIVMADPEGNELCLL